MLARAGATLLALLLLGGPPAFAQVGLVFNRTGSGARAAGMANAFIAVSDDGTAASWNPAGLGQLRKPELSIVSNTTGKTLTAAGFRTLDDRATFSPARSSYTSTDLDFASLAVPVTLWGKPVTFQGAWRRLYTLDYREVVSLTREPLVPEGPPPIRIDSNSDIVGGVDIVSLAVATKLTNRLALGGSLNLWRGDWTEDGAVSETPLVRARPARVRHVPPGQPHPRRQLHPRPDAHLSAIQRGARLPESALLDLRGPGSAHRGAACLRRNRSRSRATCASPVRSAWAAPGDRRRDGPWPWT